MLNKIQIDLIINGGKVDKDGNIVKRKRINKSATKTGYGRVKSRFKECLESACKGSPTKHQSNKHLPSYGFEYGKHCFALSSSAYQLLFRVDQ